MSANIMLMQDDSLCGKYFAEDLNKVIRDDVTEKYSEARKLWNRLGLKITVAKEEMINAVVEKLSENLTKGLLQLSVEEITYEKELKGALRDKRVQTIVMSISKELPTFKIYAELIIKSGLIELKKFRFDFLVEPNVEIEDINVTIQENEVKSISFGSFKTSVTLSLLKGEQAVEIVSIEKSLKIPDVHSEYQNEYENRLLEAIQTDILIKAELILPKRKIEITTEEKRFGRSDFENDLSTAELDYISKNDGEKYHFRIINQGEIFYIQDYNSINGTKLNGREIRGRGGFELRNNDKIELAGIDNFIITLKISGYKK